MLSNDKIAQAMEMHYGSGMSWKFVARCMKLDVTYLRTQVENAKRTGMHDRRVRGTMSLKNLARLQRQRIAKVEQWTK